MTARQHYDEFLGALYPWMTGDFESACGKTIRQFEAIGLSPERNNLAVDLGCGHGIQSIALARLGFHVQAVDFCPTLLGDLEENATRETLPITAIESDLIAHLRTVKGAPGVITCMGDTLAHLESLQAVSEMIHLASRRIARGGTLVLEFRDHFSKVKPGDRVEIPGRRCDGRFFTTRLEGFDNSVRVIDELVERRAGRWVARASFYEKLRLKPAWIAAELRRAGLKITKKESRDGMITFTATKPFPVQTHGWMTALTSGWRMAS